WGGGGGGRGQQGSAPPEWGRAAGDYGFSYTWAAATPCPAVTVIVNVIDPVAGRAHLNQPGFLPLVATRPASDSFAAVGLKPWIGMAGVIAISSSLTGAAAIASTV